MEKEDKKATASEKLTKVVAIRISQTDYDIFFRKSKNGKSGIHKNKYFKILMQRFTRFHNFKFSFLKKNFRQVEQVLLNIDSKLLQIEKKFGRIFLSGRNVGKNSECKRQLEKLEFDFQKLEEEISKWQSPN